jgi:hypothetical protein
MFDYKVSVADGYYVIYFKVLIEMDDEIRLQGLLIKGGVYEMLSNALNSTRKILH